MPRIGGLVGLSATDWPDMLSAVVFCQGCPWRCRYCHNPQLMRARSKDEIPWERIIAFLVRRRGLLDGVVFSGGEPTLQSDLQLAMREVRELGFGVGLHTAGIYPKRLREVLPLVDWVGFDIKAPHAGYDDITGVRASAQSAYESLDLVLASGVAYQIRTTVHPALLSEQALEHLAIELKSRGAIGHVRQPFRSQGCLDPALLASASAEAIAP